MFNSAKKMPRYCRSRNPRPYASSPAVTTPQAMVRKASVMPRYRLISPTV